MLGYAPHIKQRIHSHQALYYVNKIFLIGGHINPILIDHLLSEDIYDPNLPFFQNYIDQVRFIHTQLDQFDRIDELLINQSIQPTKNNRIRERCFIVDHIQHSTLFDLSWINKGVDCSTGHMFKKLKRKIQDEVRKCNDEISLVINYEYIKPEHKDQLLYQFNIPVCPYCNRQYINSYDYHGQTKSTADLDHFLPKSVFPLFAMSLYNFVPSCQICNQRLKKDISTNILNPMKDEFGDEARFMIKFPTHSQSNDEFFETIMGLNTSFHIDIAYSGHSSKCLVENSIAVFRLKELYQSHKSYALEVLRKKTQIQSYYSEVHLLVPNMSRTDFNVLLYGFDIDHGALYLKPLSKFTKDIIDLN